MTMRDGISEELAGAIKALRARIKRDRINSKR